MADGIFTETAPENPLETLVGEGKKYTSVEELAKAYVNADAFINNLKRENEEQRAELQTRLTIEEQLRNIKNETRQEQITPKVETPPVGDQALNPETLIARVREELKKDSEKEAAQANLETVANRLIDAYGDTGKSAQVVKQRAAELGVSVQFLEEVAAKSPKAFFAQIGLDSSPKQTTQAPRSDMNSTALGFTGGSPKVGSYEYYENLRKTEPKRYFTPQIQNQLMKDASEGRWVAPG